MKCEEKLKLKILVAKVKSYNNKFSTIVITTMNEVK